MSIQVVGIDKATRQLEFFSKNFGPEVKRAIAMSGELARGHMQRTYLSGSPLRVRTGKLRSNWQVRTTETPNEYAATVGTNTVYARVHNDGFRGNVQVPAHTRRAPSARASRSPRSREARRRSRGEARAAQEHRQRLEQTSQASHGLTRGQLATRRRRERRALGLQGGVTGPRVRTTAGYVSVRAHGRFMRIQGHRYVERTMRDVKAQVQELLRRAHRKALSE